VARPSRRSGKSPHPGSGSNRTTATGEGKGTDPEVIRTGRHRRIACPGAHPHRAEQLPGPADPNEDGHGHTAVGRDPAALQDHLIRLGDQARPLARRGHRHACRRFAAVGRREGREIGGRGGTVTIQHDQAERAQHQGQSDRHRAQSQDQDRARPAVRRGPARWHGVVARYRRETPAGRRKTPAGRRKTPAHRRRNTAHPRTTAAPPQPAVPRRGLFTARISHGSTSR